MRSLASKSDTRFSFYRRFTLCVVGFYAWLLLAHNLEAQTDSPVILEEFIYEQASFPQCHASTIEQTPNGLVVAWFGGTREGNADVEIWLARQVDAAWTAPVSVADGIQEDGTRFPCWNPVLLWHNDRLILFYKVGPNPREWWGMMKVSQDQGATWSESRRLPDGILGPIKNKPIVLESGRIVCGSSTEHDGWRVHVEWSDDGAQTWHRTDALNEKGSLESIQPTLFLLPDGKLQMLCRSLGVGTVTTATSSNAGETWSPLSELELPNPNSGIDGVTLDDGRHVLIYNHTPKGRSPLNLALSLDGRQWRNRLTLVAEEGAEFSYPAVIQTDDGRLHVTYTWKRQRIRHVVIDPKQLD